MSKHLLTLTAIALGLAIAAPQTGLAQVGGCNKHEMVVDKLGSDFGERLAGRGIASPTVMFELYASEETGTWTILRTDVTGTTCVMISGEVWEQHDPKIKENVSLGQ